MTKNTTQTTMCTATCLHNKYQTKNFHKYKHLLPTRNAPPWKRILFSVLTWARGIILPDETEHLWRGMLPGDLHTCLSEHVLGEPISSGEDLRALCKDIFDFLLPLSVATQAMLSLRGQLFFAADGATLPMAAAPPRCPLIPTHKEASYP